MSQIHVTYPGLHKYFMNRWHDIGRSDRFWAGLSPVLVIQQDLMRKLLAWLEDVELKSVQKYFSVKTRII